MERTIGIRKAKTDSKGLWLLVSLMSTCIGCAAISRSVVPGRAPSPFPIQRMDFRARLDEAWAATLEVARMSQGFILGQNRDSGRITYAFFHRPGHERIEMNVLLKDGGYQDGEPITAVFLNVLAPPSVDGSVIADDFFEKLNRNLTRR